MYFATVASAVVALSLPVASLASATWDDDAYAPMLARREALLGFGKKSGQTASDGGSKPKASWRKWGGVIPPQGKSELDSLPKSESKSKLNSLSKSKSMSALDSPPRHSYLDFHAKQKADPFKEPDDAHFITPDFVKKMEKQGLMYGSGARTKSQIQRQSSGFGNVFANFQEGQKNKPAKTEGNPAFAAFAAGHHAKPQEEPSSHHDSMKSHASGGMNILDSYGASRSNIFNGNGFFRQGGQGGPPAVPFPALTKQESNHHFSSLLNPGDASHNDHHEISPFLSTGPKKVLSGV